MSEIACAYLMQRYEIFYAALAGVVVVITLCYLLLTPQSSTGEDDFECQSEEDVKFIILRLVIALAFLFVLPTPGELSSMLSPGGVCSVSK